MNRYYEHPTEKNFRSPVYNVRAVPVEKIVAEQLTTPMSWRRPK